MTSATRQVARFDTAATVHQRKPNSEQRVAFQAETRRMPDELANRHRREAVTRLHESGYPALCGLGCTSRNGVLVIQGKVPTYYLKQLAQTFVRQIDGVNAVINNVQVTKS